MEISQAMYEYFVQQGKKGKKVFIPSQNKLIVNNGKEKVISNKQAFPPEIWKEIEEKGLKDGLIEIPNKYFKRQKTNYVVWRTKEVPDAFVLDELSEVEDDWEIVKGVPRAATFPFNVTFSVDPDFPDDILLIDAFETTEAMTVISPRLKAFFEKRAVKQVEYLPVTILDHKGKPAAEYFILHPVYPVECLNLEDSEAKWDFIDDTTIGKVKRIVFDESKVGPELQIFKIKYLYDVIIVRRDLAEAMAAEGFTGMQWTELADFKKS
ncbi:hypothetical protein KAR10_06155 [bacterium]|nr:hypothetical protein [bacterium]